MLVCTSVRITKLCTFIKNPNKHSIFFPAEERLKFIYSYEVLQRKLRRFIFFFNYAITSELDCTTLPLSKQFLGSV